MKNYIQPGDSLNLAAPYDRLSGQGALVGGIFGVAAIDVLSGVSADFVTRGVFNLTKVGSQAWTPGQAVHWDDTNKRCTTVANVGPMIGAATETVGSGAGVVLGKVLLMPGVAGQEASGPQAAIANTVAAAAATAGGSGPTAAQVDTGVAAAVAPLVVSINLILAELRLAGIIAP
jgi:predicted RecA/RadA family phage recombinase